MKFVIESCVYFVGEDVLGFTTSILSHRRQQMRGEKVCGIFPLSGCVIHADANAKCRIFLLHLFLSLLSLSLRLTHSRGASTASAMEAQV